jgi:hypothetical protein
MTSIVGLVAGILIVVLVTLVFFLIGLVSYSGWEWIPKKYRLFYRKFKDGIYDWLIKKGLPWRRVLHDLIIAIAITILIILVGLIIIVLVLLVLYPSVVQSVLEQEVNYLTALGNRLGLNGQEFSTYISAQVLADLISAVVIFVIGGILAYVFFGKFWRRDYPTHDIKIYGNQPEQVVDDGRRILFVLVSNNKGDEAANDCKARVTFKGLTWRDVVDLPKSSALYSSHSRELASTNYFSRSDLAFNIEWAGAHTHQTILSGEAALLPIIWLVPARESTPEHFEIRCWRGDKRIARDLAICLKPFPQRIEVKILPSGGKYRSGRFVIHKPEDSWTISTRWHLI